MGPQGLPWSARRPRGRAPIVPTSIKISVNDTKSCKSVNLKIREHFPLYFMCFCNGCNDIFLTPPDSPDIHKN